MVYKRKCGFFISGTNTDIGKTVFSALFCNYLIEEGYSVKYVKPVQTGWPESDAAYVVHNSKVKEADAITLHTHEKPVAPCLVFDAFPFQETVDYINDIEDADVVIVESAGGLMVPLDYTHFNYEIALGCHLETVVVVPNRLGCVNDSLLNYHFIKSKEMVFAGFAMNDYFMASENDKENKHMINRLTDDAVFCEFNEKIFNIGLGDN